MKKVILSYLKMSLCVCEREEKSVCGWDGLSEMP